MAFGIGRIVKAVENLSKQVTGNSVELSAAIAQSGSDLGTALNDIRHVSEANSREIAAVRRELAELCALVESRRTEAAEARIGTAAATATAASAGGIAEYERGLESVAGAGAGPSFLDDSPYAGDDQPHHDLLAHAAGVANARLICHADTWAFITEQASTGRHFRMPVDISSTKDGTVDAGLSGRTLIAVADALWQVTQSPGTPPCTLHLAAQAYNRIHAALAQISTVEAGEPVRIVIDDRAPAGAATARNH